MILTYLILIALTDPQIDRVLGLIETALLHLPTILGLCGTAFLIIKQFLNSKAAAARDAETKAAIAINTDLTHEVKSVAIESVKKAEAAYNEANNVNVKLASMGIQTKPALGETAANPVHTITP